MRRAAILFLFCLLLGTCSSAGCETLEFINGTVCTFCSKPSQNQCIGCDGVPGTPSSPPLTYDLCRVCNGDGSFCPGCDGTNSRQNYDECGVCGGDGSTCSGAPRTEPVTFDPPDTVEARLIYKYPLTVKLSTTTPGAIIYFEIQILDGDDTSTQVPPNMLSQTGDKVVLTRNATIKAFAFAPTLRQSSVSFALYRVSETGSKLPTGLALPIYLVILIAVGGFLIVIALALLITIIRVRNRNRMVKITLDVSEAMAKEENYRALYDYVAQNTDELDLKVGDVVHVKSKEEDGWWEASSYRLKGKTGMVPGNYLELIPPERLMWVERPKTMFARLSRRLSNFIGGAPSYGMDPQTAPQSRMSKRISVMFGKPQNQSQMALIPPKPASPLPPRPTGGLPPKPSGGLPARPQGHLPRAPLGSTY